MRSLHQVLTIFLLVVLSFCGEAPVPPSSGHKKQEIKTASTDKVFENIQIKTLPSRPFYKDSASQIYWKKLVHLETDGKNIFLNPLDTLILKVNQEGDFQRTIGNTGEGPGSLHPLRYGMAVRGEELWVLTVGKAQQFVAGEPGQKIIYESHYRSRWPLEKGTGNRRPAFSKETLVIPMSQDALPGQIATIYAKTGGVVGTVNDPGFQDHWLSWTPFSQNTMWHYLPDKENWVAIYQYLQRVVVFDNQFSVINEIEYNSPTYTRYQTFIDQKEAMEQRNIAFLYQSQIIKDKIYLSEQSQLLVLDIPSQRIEVIYRFRHPDPNFKPQVVAFPSRAILEDGSIILGNAFMGGELFIANPKSKKF